VLASFVLLGLLPSIWALAPQLCLTAGAVPRAPLLALTVSVARLAWNALPTPMEFLVALRLTQGGELRAGELLRSFARPADAVMIAAAAALPGQCADLARNLDWLAIALPAALIGCVALVRFAVAGPALVATRCSAIHALALSWALTRGHVFRVARALALPLVFTVILFAVAARNLFLEHAAQIVLDPIWFLITIHIYRALGGTVIAPVATASTAPPQGARGIGPRNGE
jgi:hypothetical protein